MKQFEMSITAEMVEADPADCVGTYVEAREAKKLEQQNKEMLQALKECRAWLELFYKCENCKDDNKTDRQLNGLMYKLEFIISKAEEEDEAA
jgi:hypothetical protein